MMQFALRTPSGGNLISAAIYESGTHRILCVWLGSRCFSYPLPSAPAGVAW